MYRAYPYLDISSRVLFTAGTRVLSSESQQSNEDVEALVTLFVDTAQDDDTSGNHIDKKAVLLEIYKHPDWLKHDKTESTLPSNATADSLQVPWVPSAMNQSINIGRFDAGQNQIGYVFDVSWMKTIQFPAPAPGVTYKEFNMSIPQLSGDSVTYSVSAIAAPDGNQTSTVPWTFGSCPLIIPDHSFEGELRYFPLSNHSNTCGILSSGC